MNRYSRAGVIAASGFVLACGAAPAADVEQEMAVSTPTTGLSDITDAEWSALTSRRIFFGHQSVGRDIMLGMQRVLERHPQVELAVVESADPSAVQGAAFIEGRVGRNREPQSKTDAFMTALEGGFGAEPGAVAMYKFCYVDVNADTDPAQLFREYSEAMERARNAYPGLTIVHMTLPLHAAPEGVVERMKTRFGKPTQTRLNIIRNEYNRLLLERYGSSDPVFDLALLESTRADGTRAYTVHDGQNVYMLAPEWTYDGGHLTDEAQDRVAERLLVFLARLPAGSQAEVADADGSAR